MLRASLLPCWQQSQLLLLLLLTRMAVISPLESVAVGIQKETKLASVIQWADRPTRHRQVSECQDGNCLLKTVVLWNTNLHWQMISCFETMGALTSKRTALKAVESF